MRLPVFALGINNNHKNTMAHFYASARGSRKETHRLGGKSSGAVVEARGWRDGVMVTARHDEEKGNYYEIVFTEGSNGAVFNRKYVGTINSDGTFMLQGGKIIQL